MRSSRVHDKHRPFVRSTIFRLQVRKEYLLYPRNHRCPTLRASSRPKCFARRILQFLPPPLWFLPFLCPSQNARNWECFASPSNSSIHRITHAIAVRIFSLHLPLTTNSKRETTERIDISQEKNQWSREKGWSRWDFVQIHNKFRSKLVALLHFPKEPVVLGRDFLHLRRSVLLSSQTRQAPNHQLELLAETAVPHISMTTPVTKKFTSRSYL